MSSETIEDPNTTNISGQKRPRDDDDGVAGGGDGGSDGDRRPPHPVDGDGDGLPQSHDAADGSGVDTNLPMEEDPKSIAPANNDDDSNNKMSTNEDDEKTQTTSTKAPPPAPAPAPVTLKPPPPPPSIQQASVSAASAAVASQLSASMGLQGLYSLLSLSVISGATGTTNSGGSSGGGGAAGAAGSSSSSMSASASSASGGGGSLPTIEQVQQSATKSVNDQPPFCHLSKTDSAPQLKISPDSYRMVCKGGMRGYRMTRGSHGVSEGNYYYEVIILDPPSASEIAQSLPSNVRLGRQLQHDMQEALRAEERAKNNNDISGASSSTNDHATGSSTAKNGEQNDPTESDPKSGGGGVGASQPPSKFGAHVRLGWSMRSGDLQAPVGYDRFSFAVRDIGGSKIHSSKRDDHWGGEEFGPGDVIGCAISLVPGGNGSSISTSTANAGNMGGVPSSTSSAQQNHSQGAQNHIRFFKNGYPMGEIVISKGRIEGGTAFVIPDGMYYPAVSLYMGASVQVNFGPNFIYSPRKLPAGLKFQPISSVCKPPISIEDAVTKVTKEKVFRKADMQQRFLDLVKAEVDVVQDIYQRQRRKHVQDVIIERKKRNLKTDDLEDDEFNDDMDVE